MKDSGCQPVSASSADEALEPIDAVIVAAGSGRRMGAALPKQYLELSGRTVLEHAVCHLAHGFPRLGRLVVVLAAADSHFAALRGRLEADLGDKAKALCLVTGGALRQDSVMSGLQCCHSTYVMVHDAARPLVQPHELQALCTRADGQCEGAILAAPLSDTLKRGSEGVITATVARDNLYRACTPQLFRRLSLLQAYAMVQAQGLVVTDEAMAMERYGARVNLVMASVFNFKITHKEDLLLARALLSLESLQEQI